MTWRLLVQMGTSDGVRSQRRFNSLPDILFYHTLLKVAVQLVLKALSMYYVLK